MGVCPRMEFYEIICISCLGYDCYNTGVFTVNAISLANYDVIFDITTMAEGTSL